MLMHHTLDCAKSRLHRESHWLVNRSFLLTESFCKNYLFSVTSSWCIRVNPFIVMHLTHILVHPSVHRAHRLKSADLVSSPHNLFFYRIIVFVSWASLSDKHWNCWINYQRSEH